MALEEKNNGSGWVMKPGGRKVWRAAKLTEQRIRELGLTRTSSPDPVTAQPSAERSLEALAQTVEKAIDKAFTKAARIGEPYLGISEICEKYSISRSSFYEMLPRLTAEGLAVRVPPGGPVRVPVGRFGAWLHAQAQPAAVKRARREGGR